MERDVFDRLAVHMSELAIGPPYNEHLVEILKESLSGQEALVLLSMPSRVGPFETVSAGDIADKCGLPESEVDSMLSDLAVRGLVYRRKDAQGDLAYCLHQFGYGMPQAFFWPNEDSPFARRMAELCIRHSRKEALIEGFGGTGTKVYRWIPARRTIEVQKQAVLTYADIEHVIHKAERIAVVNCNCRVMSRLKGREPCPYPLEVCMKYDDLAEYVIDVGIGRELSLDEALALNRKAEEAGCVHFADNVVEGEIKHACNCCPCCCWSLGNYKRRRIPRDLLMACQFIRKTDLDTCDGCGLCEEACPIDAVNVSEGAAMVDEDWCIGCGVCASACPNEAISMIRRTDIEDPLDGFSELSRVRTEYKMKR
ncbi:MAG: 4Fe-4S binding protein [Desulfobacteraceae bacterium]